MRELLGLVEALASGADGADAVLRDYVAERGVSDAEVRSAVLKAFVLDNPYIPQAPTIQQAIFLSDFRYEGLYGGSAGGGKSSALLMAALMFVGIPSYSALILRRTYVDLAQPGGMMDRAHEWLANTDARWHDQTKTYRFPSGARLRFGYIDNDRDKYNYQGGEYQLCAFDELTQFELAWYLYLHSRIRRTQGSAVPCLRIRAASNPGGIGHEWVRQRFLDAQHPDRFFISAGLRDNPHLDADQYEGALGHLDPYTRAQLLDGDWDARPPGALFQREWFDIEEQQPNLTGLRPVRFWDLAATEQSGSNDPDWTVGLKMFRDDFGVCWVQDVVRLRRGPGEVQRMVAAVAKQDGQAVRVRMQQDPGQAGKDQIDYYRRRVIPGFDFDGVLLSGSKWLRAQPVSGQAHGGNIKLVRGPWLEAFLAELEAFQEDPRDYAHDDQVDALSGAYHFCLTGSSWLPPKRGQHLPQQQRRGGGFSLG